MAVPETEGYYWAKWLVASDGTVDADVLCPSDEWEVVQVFENVGDTDRLGVAVTGVECSQSLENFVWGHGPLAPPA